MRYWVRFVNFELAAKIEGNRPALFVFTEDRYSLEDLHLTSASRSRRLHETYFLFDKTKCHWILMTVWHAQIHAMLHTCSSYNVLHTKASQSRSPIAYDCQKTRIPRLRRIYPRSSEGPFVPVVKAFFHLRHTCAAAEHPAEV